MGAGSGAGAVAHACMQVTLRLQLQGTELDNHEPGFELHQLPSKIVDLVCCACLQCHQVVHVLHR